MYKILKKKQLNDSITLMEIDAPFIAKKALAGQFIIYRVDEHGERIPLTIADYDREKGSITIIFQTIGASTKELAMLNEGDSILDVVGPLGVATEYGDVKRVAVVGGGVGCAIAYPQAKKLHNLGADVTVITGFRNKDLVILEDELKEVSNKLIVATDDGSNGNQGFVTDMLKKEIEAGEKFDEVIAIGPLVMMKFVCKLTEQYNIPTTVSMNPVMIDGTGMCGGCRVIVGGETKFACVDGPDFDGHKIDWDTAMKRGRMFKDYEEKSCKEGHCRIGRTNHQD